MFDSQTVKDILVSIPIAAALTTLTYFVINWKDDKRPEEKKSEEN